MKIYRQIFYSLSIVLLIVACKKPPEFPTIPEITYLNVSKKIGYEYQGPTVDPKKIDSVVISINFKDGDGDLGTADDSVQNYFCKVLVKENGAYTQLIVDTITKEPVNKDGRFLPLNPDGKQGPIEGTLNYGPRLGLKGDIGKKFTLKFLVSIKDNAGHMSNTVETDSVDIQLY